MPVVTIPGGLSSSDSRPIILAPEVFDDVDAKKVVVRNLKLYVNYAEGFIGTSLRKDKYICDCSDIDDIIVFTKSGKMQVVKVDNKIFYIVCINCLYSNFQNIAGILVNFKRIITLDFIMLN